jgi:hypothetical protein
MSPRAPLYGTRSVASTSWVACALGVVLVLLGLWVVLDRTQFAIEANGISSIRLGHKSPPLRGTISRIGACPPSSAKPKARPLVSIRFSTSATAR